MKNSDLSNLSLKELQRLKKDWWEEAENDGLLSKLTQVMKSFGRVTDVNMFLSLIIYSYNKDDLKILHTEYPEFIGYEVYYKEKLVYDYDGKLFVPGDWTSVVDSLYDKVTDKERQDLINQLTCI